MLLDAVRRGRRAILLEPLRAIAREKADELEAVAPVLSATLGCCISVRISTGDYRIDRIPAAADPPPAATYTVEANSSGYWFTRHSVDILKGEVTQCDFELLKKKFASLRGRVTDAITGDPIAGAQGGAQHVTTRATTAANGTYTQSNIDIGYRNEPLSGSVRFIADGYWPAQASATFEANKETVVDLELIPVCDGDCVTGNGSNAVYHVIRVAAFYLDYMSEPSKNKRISLGIVVLLYLAVLFAFAYWMKREYWRDVPH